MSGGVERPFLSIGEVLAVLQPEFPDVTISKIRFLEAQGLIDPERTASGYRKFYDADLRRLRFILREQKEHFLPLRVIKDRLAAEPAGPAPGVDGHAEPTPAAPPAGTLPGSAVEFSLEELAGASGLLVEQVREIESFGLLHGRTRSGVTRYGADALDVARLAAAFLRHGVEARHLRMYRSAAEREVGIIEQVVLPLAKQRNPKVRAEAQGKLDELVSLGARLRDALVRSALAPLAEPR
ncbi:MAG: MerR family transcriptional regulator [Acidimicrobiales bacterium]